LTDGTIRVLQQSGVTQSFSDEAPDGDARVRIAWLVGLIVHGVGSAGGD
jgi:hypothetical protein